MIELEKSPITFYVGKSKMTFTCGILNERLSFGKTFCLSALICSDFEQTYSYRKNDGISDNKSLGIEDLSNNIEELKIDEPRDCDPFKCYVKSDCKKQELQTTLVICGTKVSKEWKNNIKNFTSLTYCVVERANHLDELKNGICNNMDKFDVVVVKDGDITWNGKKDKAITHSLSIYGEDVLFRRIIYDDYDVLKLPAKEFHSPSAKFTWFVSGTDSDYVAPNIMYEYYVTNTETSIITCSKYSLNKTKIILDTVSSVSCNREYSIVEFDIPKIDVHYTGLNLETLIKNIINNDEIEYYCKDKYKNKSLLTGTKDVPYIYNKDTIKMLVCIKDKRDQQVMIGKLNDLGIKTVKLTKANVDKFAREDAKICVAGNLFGVNMGFLTHIVIECIDFDENEIVQMTGRGQRLSRTRNLQLYLNEGEYIYEDEYFSEEDINNKKENENRDKDI